MLKTTLISISLGALGASYFGARIHLTPSPVTSQTTNELRVGAHDASQLNVDVPLGNVFLIADGSSDLTVHAVRTIKGNMDGLARKWLKDSYVTAENKNGCLVVRDHPFGNDSRSTLYSKSKGESRSSGAGFELKLQIHAPANLIAKLSIATGTANIEGRFNTLSANVSAGTLKTSGILTRRAGDLSVGAGTLISAINRESQSHLKFEVGAGEVKLSVPQGARADIMAEVGVGEISGIPASPNRNNDGIHLGDHRHVIFGGKGATVSIEVGTGSIKLQSVEGFQEVAEDRGLDDQTIQANTDMVEVPNMDFAMDEVDTGALQENGKAIEDAAVELNRKGMDLKVEQLKSLENLGDDMSKQLEGLDHLDADIDKKLKDLGPMIEAILKKIRPEIEHAMKQAQPEIERAMREARPEIDRELKASQLEVKRAMKEVKPEIQKAIKDAMEEVKRALKEMKDSEKAHSH